jgi:hypothetical protein
MNSIQLKASANWPYHTMLRKLLLIIENYVKERYWFLSDWEGNFYPTGIHKAGKEIVITGNKLLEIIDSDFQLIWGVLSGSKNNYNNVLQPPTAESNDDLWKPGYKIQNAQSDIEIVAWDSSYTLISSSDKNVLNKFYSFFGKETANFTDCIKKK